MSRPFLLKYSITGVKGHTLEAEIKALLLKGALQKLNLADSKVGDTKVLDGLGSLELLKSTSHLLGVLYRLR